MFLETKVETFYDLSDLFKSFVNMSTRDEKTKVCRTMQFMTSPIKKLWREKVEVSKVAEVSRTISVLFHKL